MEFLKMYKPSNFIEKPNTLKKIGGRALGEFYMQILPKRLRSAKVQKPSVSSSKTKPDHF